MAEAIRDRLVCPLCRRVFIGEVEGQEVYPCGMCWAAPERVRREMWRQTLERAKEG